MNEQRFLTKHSRELCSTDNSNSPAPHSRAAGGGFASTFSAFPVPTIDYPAWAYAFAGRFVGFGAKAGNGCTSGHGLCGLSRFSLRSLAAVPTFMAAAMATATLTTTATFGGRRAWAMG